MICNELGGVKHLYSAIGIQLGIPYSKLLQLKNEDDPLSAVVNDWLSGNVESSMPISWETIVAALESPHVDEVGLADTIRKKFCQEKDQQEQVSDCPHSYKEQGREDHFSASGHVYMYSI